MSAPLAAPQPVRSIVFMGAPALQLALPSGASAVVALHGGQVLSWTTADGAERLYLSPKTRMDGSAAIRGGIPLCFPQFNLRGPLVKHGFARNLAWQLDGHDAQEHSVRVQLLLADSAQTRAWWPHGFAARVGVVLTEDGLRLELCVRNTGATAWSFSGALHTYLRVDEIAQATLGGLQGCARWDAVADAHDAQQGDVTFVGEYDSVFAAAPAPLRLSHAGVPRLSIAQSPEWGNTVVWNPGATRCAQLSDMPPDGYRNMLCVEAACIDHPVELASAAQWSGWQQLRAL